MDEMVAWIREQLDADEASDWPHRPSCQMLKPVPAGFPFDSFSCNCDVDRWPREVEAKRRILDSYEKALDRRRLFRDDVASAGALLQMVAVVKLLALPLAGRPGYRPEWAPGDA